MVNVDGRRPLTPRNARNNKIFFPAIPGAPWCERRSVQNDSRKPNWIRRAGADAVIFPKFALEFTPWALGVNEVFGSS